MRSFTKDLLNVPNSMSMARIIAAPSLMVFWLYLDMPVTGLVVGTLVGITDLFDGIAARKLNQVTDLGALIDQLGDLVFESISFLISIIMGMMWSGFLVIYLFREFTVSVMRTYVISNGGTLPSSWIGKAKSSLFQYAFFPIFLGNILDRPGVLPADMTLCGVTPGQIIAWVGMGSIMAGIAVSLISGWQYLQAFIAFYVEQQARKAQ